MANVFSVIAFHNNGNVTTTSRILEYIHITVNTLRANDSKVLYVFNRCSYNYKVNSGTSIYLDKFTNRTKAQLLQ